MRYLFLILCLTVTGWAETLPLVTGWNAVGFNVGTVTRVSAPSAAGLVFYDGATYQSRALDVTNLNAEGGTTRAFWVYATAPGTLTYEGTPGTTLPTLRAGWNLVTFLATPPAGTLIYEIGTNGSYQQTSSPTLGRPCWCYSLGAPLTVGEPTGQTIQPLLGVNAGPLGATNTSNPELSSQYRAAGVRQVRTHDFYGPFDMSVMYPDKSRNPADASSYNFSSTDPVWHSIVDNGFGLYLRLGDSYNDASPPQNASERANWVAAAQAVVRRYPPSYVEIGNEPDNVQFWPRPLTRDDYFKLYLDTARALRAANPTLKLGGPGVTPAGALTPAGQAWVRAFLDYVVANGAPLDFFSWHMYGNDPSAWGSAAAFYRQELDARGLRSVALHCTEYNSDERNPPAGVSAVDLRTKSIGAALMTSAWIGMQQNNVALAHFYRGNDPDVNAPQWYGLFTADGRRKKVADAFQLWSQMQAFPTVLATTSPSADLKVLAGRDSSGRVALLLANTGTSAQTFTVGGTFRQVTRQRVTDAVEGLPVETVSQPLTVEARTVQMVVLTP